ncbi:MAG: hypothetical protein J7M19_01260 [Planctomycetes bacterium]|nr:hypothetical protein [Planctomycetota bacterium]
MEEREPQEQTPEKREGLLSKPTMIIIGAFLALNAAAVIFFFSGSLFGGKGDSQGEQVGPSPLENKCLVNLGRIEVTKALDPMQQTFQHCNVSIKIEIPKDRQIDIEPTVHQWDAKFKEVARRAFLDADATDLSTENLAGVKSTMKRRFNELLGEELVTDIVFGDYRIF